MRSVLKWIGIILGALLALVTVFAIVVVVSVNSRMNKVYADTGSPVTAETDPASLANGEHIWITRGCGDCHGADGGGGVFIDEPIIGELYAANLTAGEGGRGQTYTDADYERVLRYGVAKDGTPVAFMEAQLFYHLSDEDTADLIGYIQSFEPVDGAFPDPKLGPLGYMLTFVGAIEMFPAELVDHDSPRPAPPEVAPTAEYGLYIAYSCMGCHNPALSGGAITGAPPETPIPLNLTPGGELIGWTYEDFALAMTTGQTPAGSQLDPFMPYEAYSNFSETELRALWEYLQTLPAKQLGER